MHRTAPLAPDAPVAPDLETRIGGRGLLYVGVLVLLLGVSFFLKYAFDNEWIDERGRVLLGALSGVGLVLTGLRIAQNGLPAFGQALTGTGHAILYMAVYAALNFYGLISGNVAFLAMVAITVAAAWSADRQRSQALAVIAVGGGFLTPFLVGGSENAQLTLFTYDALLVMGTLLVDTASPVAWPQRLELRLHGDHHRRLGGHVLLQRSVASHTALPHVVRRPLPDHLEDHRGCVQSDGTISPCCCYRPRLSSTTWPRS